MMKPFSPWLGHRAEGLLVMVARMNRIENAARLAMADLGSDIAPIASPGFSLALKFSLILVSVALTGLLAVSLI